MSLTTCRLKNTIASHSWLGFSELIVSHLPQPCFDVKYAALAVKRYLCFVTAILLLSLSWAKPVQASCTAPFTWDGAGSGNQAVFTRSQTSINTTISDCPQNIDVTVSLDNPDGAFYSAISGSNASGTDGTFAKPGYSMWLDNNNNLFDQNPLDLGEEASLIFNFSQPVVIQNFVVKDIDWRNNSGVSSRWRDKVTVTATNSGGQNIPLTVSKVNGGSTIAINGQTAVSDYNAALGSEGGLGVSDTLGHIKWESTEPLTTLKVSYITGVENTGQQIIQISNFDVNVPTPPVLPNNTGCPVGTVRLTDNLIPNHDFSTLHGTASLENTLLSGGTWQTEGYYVGENLYPGPSTVAGKETAASIFTGIHTGSVTKQWPFPGDPAYFAPAQSNFLYTNGNDLGRAWTAWKSTLTGLTPNTSYTYVAYVSNVIDPAATFTTFDPRIQLYVDGVALGTEFIVLRDSYNDQSADVWTRLEQHFKTGVNQTSVVLEIRDSTTSVFGDDLAIAGVGAFKCSIPSDSDYSDAPADGSAAPDGSSTTAYGETRHDIVAGIQLGVLIDIDSTSVTSANAEGDGRDDDGVTMPTLELGGSTTIPVVVSQAAANSGYLQGWVDWNGDGDFLDTGEQIATDLQYSGGTNGTINVSVIVPPAATTSQTFARFRWSTTSGLNSQSSASDGEVEDYALTIDAAPTVNCPADTAGSGYATSGTGAYRNEIYWFDWSCGATTRFNAGDIIRKSWNVGDGLVISATISNLTQNITPYNTGAWSGDELVKLYGGVNPIGLANATRSEDPTYDITFTTTLNGFPLNTDIVVAEAEDTGFANESATWTTDGDPWQPIDSKGLLNVQFSNGNRTLFMNESPQAGGGTLVALTENVSTISIDMKAGGTEALGFGVFTPFDYGDAGGFTPSAHYVEVNAFGGSQPNTPTPISSLTMATVQYNSGFYLGTNKPDTDSVTQLNAGASGDDATGIDDEDGVNIPAVMIQGTSETVPVAVNGSGGYLQAWVDWDGNNNFTDPSDQIASNVQDGGVGDADGVADGTIMLNVTVPANAPTGQTFARFRWASYQNLGIATVASDGEVEDYAITINKPALECIAPSTADHQITGRAFIGSDDQLVLTDDDEVVPKPPNPAYQSQSGAMWSKKRISLLSPFTFNYHVYLGNRTYNIAPSNTDTVGADGIAFALHNDPAGYNAVGEDAHGFGVGGLDPAIAIEFDTWVGNGAQYNDTTNPNDPDHTSIFDPASYTQGNGAGASALLSPVVNLGEIEDGQYHEVEVSWNPVNKNLIYTFDGVELGNITRDLVNVDFNGNPFVFYGVAGSTGYGHNRQQVCFTELPELVQFDYGDAPVSYGSASHEINSDLHLGIMAPDAEDASPYSINADGDGADEDGVSSLPSLNTLNSTYRITVNATNLTTKPGRLMAWIDFDLNGTFELDEAAVRVVPAGTAAGNFVVAWSNIPTGVQQGQSYLRLRYTTDDMNSSDAIGIKSDGEVEDYVLIIDDAGASINGRVFIDTNTDEIDNNNELGIGGTVIVLRDITAGRCRSTTTNSSGVYSFLGTAIGDYELYQAHGETTPIPQNCGVANVNNPGGYQSTTPDVLAITVADAADINDQNFGEVDSAGITFEPDHQSQIQPGSVTLYSHTLTSKADGSVSFTSTESGHTTSGWAHTVYRDNNCDGALNGTEGDASINGINFSVLAGSRVCIINKVYAPANVPVQSRYNVTTNAAFTFAGGAVALTNIKVTDITTAVEADASGLELTKTVTNTSQGAAETNTLNQASPGDVLTYRIYYRNTGVGPITDLKVHDNVPPFTGYVMSSQACHNTPAGMTCTPSADMNELNWTFTGALIGGEDGYVSYKVAVDD